MLVIYDLDRTSLFCPIADFMDKFIPKNTTLKKLYYKLYPFVHILEMRLGLLRINEEIYNRAKIYKEQFNALQVVVTARHKSFSIYPHIKAVFKDIDIPCFCIAQGLTKLSKAKAIRSLGIIKPNEEIIMYDDNIEEITKMINVYKDKATGVHIEFTKDKEIIKYVY